VLISLTIRDIVLIEGLNLNFEAGLSTLTGETGAGKSILLGALGLACGSRADRAMVRSGAEKAVAIAAFEPAENHHAYDLVADAGLEIGPGESIILRRTLNTEGRSRAFVNDQPASVALLAQLGECLVEIHGQHDGRGLMDPKTHRDLLDSYAGVIEHRDTVAQRYAILKAALRTVDQMRRERDIAASEEAFLRDSVAQLDDLDPQSGEDVALAEERRFLQQAESAMTELQDALQALTGGEGLSGRLNTALRGLERVRGALGNGDETTASGAARQSVDRAAQSLDRALIEFNEAEDLLADAAQRFDVEPGRLDQVEERLFALRAAARKHSVEVDTLAELRESLSQRLDMIDHAGDRLREAEAAVSAAEVDYATSAEALTKARIVAGHSLAKSVEAELEPLKMDKARFRVCIDTDRDKPSEFGWDKVRFEVATNPGAPFGPLDKIASGGELSRFALALKVCLVGEDAKVMVFDEVDQGVGGAVADAVGLRLSRLATNGQALVVTHSPQVAARANAHYRIEKSEADEAMRTSVVELNDDERREEIARMLSGAEITDAARAAADQLMSS
jgi:DNA repair protein RecN (Recombination protein N)